MPLGSSPCHSNSKTSTSVRIGRLMPEKNGPGGKAVDIGCDEVLSGLAMCASTYLPSTVLVANVIGHELGDGWPRRCDPSLVHPIPLRAPVTNARRCVSRVLGSALRWWISVRWL